MLDATVKALSQILSPPMRSILWRSIGLALVLIVVLAIGLQRGLSWFAAYGEGWAEGLLGPGYHTLLTVMSWVVSIAAGLGVVLGGIFLMPAITSAIAGIFVDDVGDVVDEHARHQRGDRRHQEYRAEHHAEAGGDREDPGQHVQRGVEAGAQHRLGPALAIGGEPAQQPLQADRQHQDQHQCQPDRSPQDRAHRR